MPVRGGCLYCRAELTATTKLAHVMPEALGGRRQSREICCSDCNQAFAPLEADLGEALRLAGAHLGAKTGDGRALTKELTIDGLTCQGSAGRAEVQVPGPTFDQTRKCVRFALPAGRESQARLIAWNLWQQGKSPAAIDVGEFVLEPDPQASPANLGCRVFPSRLHIGGSEHKRVLAKMALELLAHRRPALARQYSLLKARRFARYGEGEIRLMPDAASEGSGLGSSREPSPAAHATEVWSHQNLLLMRITLFGEMKFTGTLTDAWEGPPVRVAYALDPITPKRMSLLCDDVDGPKLALWHEGVRQEAIQAFEGHYDRMSRGVAAAVVSVERESAPDLAELRPLIEAEYESICAKKGIPKKRRRRKGQDS